MSSAAQARLRQEYDTMRNTFPQRTIRNVTNAFAEASEHLRPGDLVIDPDFTLFEAVGALEIMDPKMDSGSVPPGDPFEADFDVSKGLSAPEVIWIMDELFKLEAMFLLGYPLSQNIFTSLHIFRLLSPTNSYPYNLHQHHGKEEPKHDNHTQLVHIVLRAYCIGVIKSVLFMLRLIQSHVSFEEEDTVTYLFGLELLPRLEVKEALTFIANGIDWVDGSTLDQRVKNAVNTRLLLRQEALFALEDGSLAGWQSLRALILQLGEVGQDMQPVTAAFSDKVQRQLATSTPPRILPTLSWKESRGSWLQMCEDVIAAIELTSVWVRQNPHSLQNAAWTFASRTPGPNTYARAKMQDLLTTDDRVADDVSQFDLFLADIRGLVLAGDALGDLSSFQIEDAQDIRYQASRIIEGFMSKAFSDYLNFYRILCLNRCRTRRRLTQLIPALADLMYDATEADSQLNQIITPRQVRDEFGKVQQLQPMTLWTSIYRNRITQHVIQLGFETDLYLPDELGTVYMILNEVANDTLYGIYRSELFMKERITRLHDVNDAALREECEGAMIYLNSLRDHVELVAALATCLAEVYILLENSGLISPANQDYTPATLRYEARMKPLLRAEPNRWPSLDTVQRAKQSKDVTLKSLCENAPSLVKTARQSLSRLKSYTPVQARFIGSEPRWHREIKQLETVCVATTVVVSQLDSACKTRGVLDASSLGDVVELVLPGKQYHDWWVVPQLREKSADAR